MLPSFYLFGYPVSMYGLMILFGIAAGVLFALSRARVTGLKREDILFSSFYAMIGVVLGAKLLYLLTMIPTLAENAERWIREPGLLLPLLTGGFVFYGGLLGGGAGLLIYCRQYRLRTAEMLDALTPSIPLIHAFGRIGCFFAGCCYGVACAPPLGLYFDRSPFAPHGVALFPVQLLESGVNLVIFAVLWRLAKKKRATGFLFGLYLSLYAPARFLLESLRADQARGFWMGLSTSQWIGVMLLASGLAILTFSGRKKVKSTKKNETTDID